METGIVTTKISTIIGAMDSIITREKSTVITLCKICRKSLESDWFTVSIS